MRTIYLDYNATTPLDPAVRDAMLPFLGEVYGNPSSVHHVGRKARALLDEARERVSRVFGCRPSEIVFTSGGSESNNLAVLGTSRKLKEKGRHLITSSIEHHAVLHCFDYLERHEGFSVTRLPVDSEGLLDPGDLRRALRDDTVLVSIMSANNEIGTVQPVAELGSICRERGVCFHTDAVQSFGKIPWDGIDSFHADMVSVCAHKFHGPKGVGALFIRSPLRPEPLLLGGSHENEHRAGTENLASIIGFVEAVERFLSPPVFTPETLSPLCERIIDSIDSIEGAALRGSRSMRLPNTVAFTVNGSDSMMLLANLDLEGVCASSGSACSSGSLEPSHVIRALGVPGIDANSLVRFSLGRETTSEDVEFLMSVLPGVVERSRSLSELPLKNL